MKTEYRKKYLFKCEEMRVKSHNLQKIETSEKTKKIQAIELVVNTTRQTSDPIDNAISIEG